MPDRILVFIPCYNCERQIGDVLAQCAALPAGLVDEILVVDNQSTDGTVQAALFARAALTTCNVTIARNTRNYGLGGSHKSAFGYAERGKFTHVIVLHGDGQGSIDDIVGVWREGTHRLFDACLGARFAPNSRLMGYSRIRTIGNRVFNALFSMVAARRVLDLGSGLNIFARSVFLDHRVIFYPDDLRFNVYLLLGLVDRESPFMFFPVSWREDDQLSNVRLVSQALRTFSIATDFLFRRAHFRDGDHRHTHRPSYTYEIVASQQAVNFFPNSFCSGAQ